jgi:hypothetical protein
MRTLLPKIEDYPAYLEACWQEHLKPKAEDAPTVISLFAGCGGSSLGYSMAGYRELLAVEWDDHAVETFKLNFPDVQVWQGDIAELSVEECLRITGLQPGELDVLDGSPRPARDFRQRTPHDLRHTWASHMLARGADLAYVSAQLGHANPSITLRIYSHWVPGTRRVTTSILDTKPASTPEINHLPSCNA